MNQRQILAKLDDEIISSLYKSNIEGASVEIKTFGPNNRWDLEAYYDDRIDIIETKGRLTSSDNYGDFLIDTNKVPAMGARRQQLQQLYPDKKINCILFSVFYGSNDIYATTIENLVKNAKTIKQYAQRFYGSRTGVQHESYSLDLTLCRKYDFPTDVDLSLLQECEWRK